MPDALNQTTNPGKQLPGHEPDWRLTLPAHWAAPARDADGNEVNVPLREHPALAKYATKDEAIKALVHAQRLLGKKSEPASLLSPPTGRPDSPADYNLPELELPEDFSVDAPLRAAYLDKAHELGLTDEQAGGLYAWFLPFNIQALHDHSRRQTDERLQTRERELAALRQVHGGAAASVLEAARKAVLALGGKELMQRLEASGAADDARVVQAFARVAPLVSETAIKGRDAAPAQGTTPQRLREMMRDPRYFDPSRRDDDYVRQVREGFEALYPGETSYNPRA